MRESAEHRHHIHMDGCHQAKNKKIPLPLLSLASFCVAASLVPVFGKPSDQIRVEAPPVAAAFLPQPQE